MKKHYRIMYEGANSIVLGSAAAVFLAGCLVLVDTESISEGCPPGQKPCERLGHCVSNKEAEFGCAGSSCQPCALAHANSSCGGETGECTVASCADGWDDCDKEAENGCEANLFLDAEHCGVCDLDPPCALPHSEPACASGQCSISACDDGYKDCNRDSADGCETAIESDRDNCGACGLTCADAGTCDQNVCE